MSGNMAALEQRPTAYEILGVHPSAPAELISACYWAITKDLQERRATEPEADVALHRLTHAYESVSDPVRRGGYNLSIGYTDEPLMKRALPRRRFFLLRVLRRSHELGWSVDPHEVLALHARAPQASVPVAYRLMRDTYLRLPPESRRREVLLNLLDESYAVLEDPQKRAQLAGAGPAEERELPAPERDNPPVGDPPEPSQPNVAEAKVALPSTAPAPAESPKPPGQAAGATVAFAAAVAGTVARGVLWVVLAVAAASVVVAGGVATAVHWAALALAALTAAAARLVAPYVRSAWLATRRWLSPSWEDRQESSRSGDASGQAANPDEVFLGRLASTVGKPKTERRRSSDETTRR